MTGLLMVWLGVVGLCGHHLTGGHGLAERSSGEQDSAATACVGHQLLLDKQSAIEQDLRALRDSMAGRESSQDLLELKNKLRVVEAKLETSKTKLEATETKLETAETQIKSMEGRLAAAEVKETGASTFVRWGRNTCSNSSQLLYSGVVGGSQHTHTGAAANALCLTMEPEFDSTPLPLYYAYIYGAEYEHIPNHHQHDVPCSVCRTPHPTTLMIPSTHSCPSGWTTQYTGHLVAGHYTHPAATEFVCLDEEPEDVSGGQTNKNGYLFYYVAYACGSLPCPPYADKKVALCVVCSK